MPKKVINLLFLLFAVKTVAVLFISYEKIWYLALFSTFILCSVSLKYLTEKITATAIAFLGFGVLSFFDVFKFNTIFVALADNRVIIKEAHHDTAIWVYLCFLLFLIGYKLSPAVKEGSEKKITKANTWSIMFVFFPFALFCLVGYRIGHEVLGSHNPYLLLLSFIPKAAAVVSFFLLLQRKKIVYLVLFALFMLAYNEISRRVYITFSFIIISMVMSYALSKYGKINSFFKLLVGVLFGCAFFFMNYLRADTEGSTSDTINSTVDYMLQFQAIDTFDNTAFVFETFPDKYRYYYGGTYFAVLFQFMPRSLWANKPVSLGGPLGLLKKTGDRDFTVQKWKKKVQGFSYSPGFMGEAYANFGYLGVVLLSLIFGYSTKRFDNKFKFEKVYKEFSYLPYLAFYSSFFLLLRGDFLMATYYSILFYLYLSLVIKFFSRRFTPVYHYGK